jgi:ABC-2 type transport system ATP-binding protein
VTTHQVEEIEHILTDLMFIRDGKIVLSSTMDEVADRFVEVMVMQEHYAAAKAMNPIDERQVFGKSIMLFDGIARNELSRLGETRNVGIADLFVATMKGTYA